jgi:shikimate 5-dehydrogenase
VLAAVERWPGATAVVSSRSHERAKTLVKRFARIATLEHTYEFAVRDAGLIVNATPTGLTGDAVPVDPSLFAPDAMVLISRTDGA